MVIESNPAVWVYDHEFADHQPFSKCRACNRIYWEVAGTRTPCSGLAQDTHPPAVSQADIKRIWDLVRGAG